MHFKACAISKMNWPHARQVSNGLAAGRQAGRELFWWQDGHKRVGEAIQAYFPSEKRRNLFSLSISCRLAM